MWWWRRGQLYQVKQIGKFFKILFYNLNKNALLNEKNRSKFSQSKIFFHFRMKKFFSCLTLAYFKFLLEIVYWMTRVKQQFGSCIWTQLFLKPICPWAIWLLKFNAVLLNSYSFTVFGITLHFPSRVQGVRLV